MRQVWLCHQGTLIYVGQDENKQCLCPPNYYGNGCQYQKQRVSLTLRLQNENLGKFNVIGVIVGLVDNTGLIHSHEQFTYIPGPDCNTKFDIYLLYRDRPKDMTKNYTIHIEAYDKINLRFLTTWKLPVKFNFMPVNRESALLLCCQEKQICMLNKTAWLDVSANYDPISPITVKLTIPMECRSQSIHGVRYLWRETPCQFKEVAVYSTADSNLPAPPFIYFF
ncbi:unnamed protein product [Rotaria sp. Silwood1]|nr:unnamed protein product [Rotaria sp. Silwood1]